MKFSWFSSLTITNDVSALSFEMCRKGKKFEIFCSNHCGCCQHPAIVFTSIWFKVSFHNNVLVHLNICRQILVGMLETWHLLICWIIVDQLLMLLNFVTMQQCNANVVTVGGTNDILKLWFFWFSKILFFYKLTSMAYVCIRNS